MAKADGGRERNQVLVVASRINTGRREILSAVLTINRDYMERNHFCLEILYCIIFNTSYSVHNYSVPNNNTVYLLDKHRSKEGL